VAARLLAASMVGSAESEAAHLALSEDESLSATARDEALVRAADGAWREGRGVEAAERYEAVRTRTVDDARARLLDVKATFARDPSTPGVVRAYLTAAVRGERAEVDPLVLGVALERWRSPVESAVHRAFRAQQLFLRDACAEALPLATSSSFAEAPPALTRAMVRGALVCACLEGDARAVDAALASARDQWPRGYLRTLRDHGARCVVRESTTVEKKSLTMGGAHERNGVPPRE
jgi:hypothetical protein